MELEKDVEGLLVREVENIGGLCYKFVSPNSKGVPDRIVIFQGCTYFVELKRPGGKLSPLQVIELGRIRQKGGKAFVLRSKKDVHDFVGALWPSDPVPDYDS